MRWAGEAATLRVLLAALEGDDHEGRLTAFVVAEVWQGLIGGGSASEPWPALHAALPAFSEALRSDEPQVAQFAAQAVPALPDPSSLRPQLQILAADSTRPEVQDTAARSLMLLERRWR